MGDSSKSNFYAQSQLQGYGWRAILVEFLYGMVVIAWNLLCFAERITLKGLSRLEKVAPHNDDLSLYGRANKVLSQDERPYFRLRRVADHDTCSSNSRSL